MMNKIQSFLDQSHFSNLHTVDGSKGQCDSVAVALKRYLKEQHNLESEVIEGIGLKPELHETAHEDWQQFKGKDQKFLAHVVLKLNDQVIDLTGAQFNENNKTRIIYPLSTFKSEWKQIKTPKALNK